MSVSAPGIDIKLKFKLFNLDGCTSIEMIRCEGGRVILEKKWFVRRVAPPRHKSNVFIVVPNGQTGTP